MNMKKKNGVGYVQNIVADLVSVSNLKWNNSAQLFVIFSARCQVTYLRIITTEPKIRFVTNMFNAEIFGYFNF